MSMTWNELLDRLELDAPADFEYFEHFSELMEITEDIPFDFFYKILSEAPASTLSELADNYFEDILLGIPDNTVDIYTLLTAIRQNLFSLAQNTGNTDVRRQFADQLYQFKNWYTQNGLVHCVRIHDQKALDVSLCEAFALCRLEKLNEDQYDYDFSDCLDYDLAEYSVSLGSPVFLPESSPSASQLDSEEEDHTHLIHSHAHGHGHGSCDCGCEDGHDVMENDDLREGSEIIDPFSDGLVDPDNPVIDGEFSDDAADTTDLLN